MHPEPRYTSRDRSKEHEEPYHLHRELLERPAGGRRRRRTASSCRRRKRSPALGNLQPLSVGLGSPPVPLTTEQEGKHLPSLLQPPICLIQHSIEQDAKRAGQEVEGGRRDGKEGTWEWSGGRGRGVKATWGYKYESREMEGLL